MLSPFGVYEGTYYVYQEEETSQRRLNEEEEEVKASKFSWTIKNVTD
jgi:hypothetical protein